MSMRDLAKRTRRAPATLYNYVASKDELLYAIQHEAFEELAGVADRAVASADEPEERLRRFVYAHVEFFGKKPHLLRVLIHEAKALPANLRGEIRDQKDSYFEKGRLLVEAVMRARATSEPDALEVERRTYCLFGMLNWTYGWYEPSRHGGTKELACAIERTALGGIAQ